MYKTLDFVNFCLKNKVERLWSFVLVPYPGTKMWDIAKERGKVKDKGFDWDSLDCQNYTNPMLLDDPDDLERFKRVFMLTKNLTLTSRYKKILSFIRKSPMDSLLYFMQQPLLTLNLLNRRQDV
jgi:hypothetical protein